MFIGIAGSAAASGYAIIMYEWHCYTMPQFLKMRFGGQRIRIWLAVVNTFLTIVSGISPLSVSLFEIDGYQSITNIYLKSASNHTYEQHGLYGNMSCGFPPDNSFHIFRSVDDPGYPVTGMLFGLTILATDAWCTNQVCVQRSLSAKTLTHAKAGVILAAYLKFLPFVFFVIPGMISRILFPDEIACSDPDACTNICDNAAGCTNIAYPILVNRLLPIGLKGLMMAALLSALMSSLTSNFNSSATLFTMDMYRPCRPKAKEKELMIVSRLWTVVLAGISIAWLPILGVVQGAKFWDYIQSIASYLLPPVVMVFYFGIFWKRTTEVAAFWTMVIGLAIGIIRMGLEWSKSGSPCGSNDPDERFAMVYKVHYLHFAMILAGISTILLICISFVTKPRTKKQNAAIKATYSWKNGSVASIGVLQKGRR
ncbi:hypothetical protein LSH36_192g01047 [Paralvinella palmiformis]|uniref:Sodium/glucose cotransporter 4 n=1 Tax=Paralvinella palmiformis TaxID=53620 RepID=A0AAD9JSJ4_9ANNE|nr:hypothetical protein LSH36_192g01047 [Paralvinella palmiformis]